MKKIVFFQIVFAVFFVSCGSSNPVNDLVSDVVDDIKDEFSDSDEEVLKADACSLLERTVIDVAEETGQGEVVFVNDDLSVESCEAQELLQNIFTVSNNGSTQFNYTASTNSNGLFSIENPDFSFEAGEQSSISVRLKCDRLFDGSSDVFGMRDLSLAVEVVEVVNDNGETILVSELNSRCGDSSKLDALSEQVVLQFSVFNDAP